MGLVTRPRWTSVLFDLDGTLIDTRPGIQSAVRAALMDVMGDAGGIDQANLSLPLDAMIRSAAPSATPDMQERLAIAFREHYDADDWKTAEVYPHAEESLRKLRSAGVRAFVVTNKRERAAQRLLEYFHLADYFEGVVGQPDHGTPTPKAELADRVLNGMDLDPASIAVVGDSDQDAEMAASRGMTFIAFTSGAGPLSQAGEGRNRVEMDSLSDVAAFVVEGKLWRKS